MRFTHDSKFLAVAVLVASGLAGTAAAQCAVQWQPTTGTNGAVFAFTELASGDLVAGGSFTSIGGVTAAGIARRSSVGWQPIGTGISGTVRVLAEMPNGDLIAGGEFLTAGGAAANHIARWDGANWWPLAGGVSGSLSGLSPTAVHALLPLSNGDLIVGGHFVTAGTATVNHIAYWNGSSWSALGGGMSGSHLSPPPNVQALVTLPNGDLVAGGQFVGAGGNAFVARIARWTGLSWVPMNAGWNAPGIFEPVRRLWLEPGGQLFGIGSINLGLNPGNSGTGPFVAQWTGSTWTRIGPTLGNAVTANEARVTAAVRLPDGDLLIGGRNLSPTAGIGTNMLLRFDGTSWAPVVGTQLSDVEAMQMAPNGQLAVGGSFATVGGLTSPAFAELVAPCPATAVTVGTGCVGSGGLNTLSAATLPWIGSTFRSIATGMPANSATAAITSLSPTTMPLSLVLPIGGAGCLGLLDVNLAEYLVPIAGRIEPQVVIPDVAAFVGVTLYQYVAAIEFGSASSAIALTSTNRLALTLGIY